MEYINYRPQSEGVPLAGSSSRSPRHSWVVSGSRDTKNHSSPSPIRSATGVQRPKPPRSWEMDSMRMIGTKSRPPHATGDPRRRLEYVEGGITGSALPEPGKRSSHISVHIEPGHGEDEEKGSVNPDFCHDISLQNLPVEDRCDVKAYP